MSKGSGQVPTIVLDILAAPFSESTVKNLSNAIRRMLEFFHDHDFSPPFSRNNFFHWLVHIATDGRERPEAALLQARSAGRILFDLLRVSPHPIDDPSIDVVISGLITRFTSKAQQHAPVFLEHLSALYAFLDTLPSDFSLWDHRTLRAATVVVLGLHIAARPSDLTCIERSELKFGTMLLGSRDQIPTWGPDAAGAPAPSTGASTPMMWRTYVKFDVLGSKTDSNMQGYNEMVFGLDHARQNHCPVALLSAYVAATGGTALSGPLFRTISEHSKPIKPATISSDVVFLFELASLPRFTGHSIRPTSATAMFTAGVAEPIILKVGRWSIWSLHLVLRHYVGFTERFRTVGRALALESILRPTTPGTQGQAQRRPSPSVATSDHSVSMDELFADDLFS